MIYFSVLYDFTALFLYQTALSRLIWNSVSRQLDSYSEVCEALKIVELLLGYLSMTGGDPKMKLVIYLQEILKMDQNINQHILKVITCTLSHSDPPISKISINDKAKTRENKLSISWSLSWSLFCRLLANVNSDTVFVCGKFCPLSDLKKCCNWKG